jgi:hypothetical protein
MPRTHISTPVETRSGPEIAIAYYCNLLALEVNSRALILTEGVRDRWLAVLNLTKNGPIERAVIYQLFCESHISLGDRFDIGNSR